MDLGEWIETYARAWETADEDLVASVFTEDASYRSSPFREPFHGHDEIRAYWLKGALTRFAAWEVRVGRRVVGPSR